MSAYRAGKKSRSEKLVRSLGIPGRIRYAKRYHAAGPNPVAWDRTGQCLFARRSSHTQLPAHSRKTCPSTRCRYRNRRFASLSQRPFQHPPAPPPVVGPRCRSLTPGARFQLAPPRQTKVPPGFHILTVDNTGKSAEIQAISLYCP